MGIFDKVNNFIGNSLQNGVQGQKISSRPVATSSQKVSVEKPSTLNVLSTESFEVSGEELRRFAYQVIQGNGLFL